MDVAELRARFDREVRANPPEQVGRVTEWCDGVLRHTVSYNFIDWWDFGAERAFEIAAREAAFYRPLGDLKWKVYSYDAPDNLGEALAAADFVVGGRETFLALDLDAPPDWPAPSQGVEVRRIEDRAGVADMMAVNEAAFGEPGNWTVEFLTAPPRRSDPGALCHLRRRPPGELRPARVLPRHGLRRHLRRRHCARPPRPRHLPRPGRGAGEGSARERLPLPHRRRAADQPAHSAAAGV